MDKLDSAYKTIGEVVKILKLKSNKNGMYNSIIIPVKPEWHLKLNDMIIEINII